MSNQGRAMSCGIRKTCRLMEACNGEQIAMHVLYWVPCPGYSTLDRSNVPGTEKQAEKMLYLHPGEPQSTRTHPKIADIGAALCGK